MVNSKKSRNFAPSKQNNNIINLKIHTIMEVIKKVMSVNHDDLVNLFSTATYDSNWLGVTTKEEYGAIIPNKLADIMAEYEKRGESYCREDKWADILLNGGSIVMVDYYDEDEDGEEGKCYPINLEVILRGLNKAFEVCPRNMENILNEDADYYDADNVIQCVLFDEVIYG